MRSISCYSTLELKQTIMSSISTILAPQFHTSFFHAKCSTVTASDSLHMITDSDFLNKKKKQVSLQLSSLMLPPISRVDNVTFCNFAYIDPWKPSDEDEELGPYDSFEYGNFVARKALLDQELLMAAWIRAECQWNNQTHTIYRDAWKSKFAELEYNSIKNRTRERNADCESSTCVVTVRKKLNNAAPSETESVVATLDLNIRLLLQGENFPGERVNPPRFCAVNRTPLSRYGYIANLFVAKSARHPGITNNMLHFAVEYAKSKGVARVYLHVDRNNELAQRMHRSLGFEVVEMASPLLIKQQTYLLCLQV